MDTMPRQGDRFTRKLQLLASNSHWTSAKIADKIGVSAQQFANYLSGSLPRPSTALAIAKLFDVSVEWLIDESIPVKPTLRPGQALRWDHFQQEAARRYKEEAFKLLDYIEEIRDTNWEEIAKRIERIENGDEIDPVTSRKMDLAATYNAIPVSTIEPFNLHQSAVFTELELKRWGIDRRDLKPDELMKRFIRAVMESGIVEVYGIVMKKHLLARHWIDISQE